MGAVRSPSRYWQCLIHLAENVSVLSAWSGLWWGRVQPASPVPPWRSPHSSGSSWGLLDVPNPPQQRLQHRAGDLLPIKSADCFMAGWESCEAAGFAPLAAGSCLSIAAAPTPRLQRGVSVTGLSGCHRHWDSAFNFSFW